MTACYLSDANLSPLSDLSGFLDAHLTYIEQYREILLDVKKDWSASCVFRSPT